MISELARYIKLSNLYHKSGGLVEGTAFSFLVIHSGVDMYNKVSQLVSFLAQGGKHHPTAFIFIVHFTVPNLMSSVKQACA